MSDRWPTYFSRDVVREAFGPRLGGYTIALEAWRRGLRVTFLDNLLRKYEISDGLRTVRFDKTRPSLTTREAVRIEQNKHRASSYLREAGVPVPESRVVDPAQPSAEKELLDYANVLGYPLVLKPLRGSMGRDVFTNIRTQKDLVETFRYMANRTSPGAKIVLEEYFNGEDYRVLVVGDRAVAACLRKPANVRGDGQSTIQELVDAKNALRQENPYLCKKLIVRDREVDQYLQQQGYTLESVPAAGEEVRLRGKANASQGGDSIDRTSAVPGAVKQAAVRAVAAIPGLAIAGVDVLYDEARLPVEDSFRVIEMNSRPEIEINMYPWEGQGQDAPLHIVDVFFPETRRSEDGGIQTTALNLEQLLVPLRGASADRVQVKVRPSHTYPVRWVYKHKHKGAFSAEEQRRVHLAARRAGIAGHCSATHGRIVICGTEDRAKKFLKLVSPDLVIDLSTRAEWQGIVAQGFDFQD